MNLVSSSRMGIALLLAIVGTNSLAVEVTLTTLQGKSVTGELTGLDSTTLHIQTPAGVKAISVADAHWLAFPSAMPSQRSLATGHIELNNGSLLPAEAIRLTESGFSCRLAPPLVTASGPTFALPYNRVAAFAFQNNSEAIQDQWRRINRNGATSDLIVVNRKQGETLDYVEGVVNSVSDKELLVEMDGEELTVPATKVYGVICFRPDAPKQSGTALLNIRTRTATLKASSVDWSKGQPIVATLPGKQAIKIPASELASIDFSRGALVWLSDLSPLHVTWQPYFPAPGDPELAVAWGRMRVDRSYSGGKLSLLDSAKRLTHYQKGLAIRSRGEATYRRPDGTNWLRATVGLDPKPRVRGSVTLRVEGDGQLLLNLTFRTGQQPYEMALAVGEYAAIRIVVDYGSAADAGDNLHLCNARFTK